MGITYTATIGYGLLLPEGIDIDDFYQFVPETMEIVTSGYSEDGDNCIYYLCLSESIISKEISSTNGWNSEVIPLERLNPKSTWEKKFRAWEKKNGMIKVELGWRLAVGIR